MEQHLDITKKEIRHRIYTIALEKYSDMLHAGLCITLLFSLKETLWEFGIIDGTGLYYIEEYKRLSPLDYLEYYPEIYKHKPENSNGYWFDLDSKGFVKRISILEEAFEETL